MEEIRPLIYRDGALMLLDQRLLPAEETWIECRDHLTVAEAIRTLTVRGAPAIGLAAGYGAVLAAQTLFEEGVRGEELRRKLDGALELLAGTRPTAVNLFWALQRMRVLLDSHPELDGTELVQRMLDEAHAMTREDAAGNRAMAEYGATLIPDGANILTHCNAGALVSSEIGTALGVVRCAHEQGKQIHVWVDETRPLLQGARLTAWELQKLGVPCTLITDNMAGHFMARGRVNMVITGADRITANGDTANKIGTYSVAVLADAHGIPFYVAAPTSTVDLDLPDGSRITIEERKPVEVTSFREAVVAPEGINVANPAFDVTPARLIAGIVTEQGIARPPFTDDLAEHVRRARGMKDAQTVGV